MHVQQEAVLETLRRIQRFLDDNGATLGAVIQQSSVRTRLDETVAQIGSHAVLQVAGRRTAEGETAKQKILRVALRTDHMRPVALIAGQKLREQPEFKLLRMPPWNVRGPRLTAAARDMANAAEKYTDLFVQEGLPSDFVAELRTAADQLDQSIDVRGLSRGQRAGATTGLRAETSRARKLILVLDSLVRPKLGTNDELLRQWQVATHVQRSRSSQNAAPAGGTLPAATPSSSPAAATPSAAPVEGESHTTPTPAA
jgi:hypothetical protein